MGFLVGLDCITEKEKEHYCGSITTEVRRRSDGENLCNVEFRSLGTPVLQVYGPCQLEISQ